jgi:rhomboid family GlyGly-CTERM serine protease
VPKHGLTRGLPWVTLVLVLAGSALAVAPDGITELLQHERSGAASGELWRPVTGQLVHWSGRMALLDLGALLILGAWLEIRSRKTAVSAYVLGLGLIGIALPFLPPRPDVYRGSSGIASAVVVALALHLATVSPRPSSRILAAAGLALFAAKVLWETLTGGALAAGPLPPGVEVVPAVHAAGGLAGLLACLVSRERRTPRHQGPS